MIKNKFITKEKKWNNSKTTHIKIQLSSMLLSAEDETKKSKSTNACNSVFSWLFWINGCGCACAWSLDF